ncbi:MAG: AmmeMemoRadiSam system radical SAM enzyme [Myxococcota bacterium]|nr:AmmeMemoRadiSam system radical SAM enzyme [Myxococcota bacterium]
MNAGIVQCRLCPKECRIAPGEAGNCNIRVNLDGELLALTYSHPSALHVDPIEKKPLAHFLPGSEAFSVATCGCNLHCRNCQNWELSQTPAEDADVYYLPPAQLVAAAVAEGCASIAYTYSEPLVYYEYTYDSAVLAREAGLRNVLVTAGFVNEEPARRLFAVTDAANIDLKSMDPAFYRDVCDAELKPVLDTIVLARELGLWVEITNLVIPTLNDEPAQIRELARWIVRSVGPETPLHLSRFSPRYRMQNLPPTPAATLAAAREVALDEGLQQVFVGNIRGTEGEHSYCPVDGAPLIRRVGYQIVENRIGTEGRCPECGTEIAGVWK